MGAQTGRPTAIICTKLHLLHMSNVQPVHALLAATQQCRPSVVAPQPPARG
eukprot:CAMPEP_0113840958 /NCGR_PEP_ID=MMETSP0328-20130328/11891_1 /TAXON_ID=39455 /ORGANISM="Alexandrium minutum" /LENGTH=50 /DNA_ID=CAMNT_0000809675 /DNA_START=48 /DNA_END=197 /DNA_ORIENTATION=+ /assembly_acc=CAM_ASM_000350